MIPIIQTIILLEYPCNQFHQMFFPIRPLARPSEQQIRLCCNTKPVKGADIGPRAPNLSLNDEIEGDLCEKVTTHGIRRIQCAYEGNEQRQKVWDSSRYSQSPRTGQSYNQSIPELMRIKLFIFMHQQVISIDLLQWARMCYKIWQDIETPPDFYFMEENWVTGSMEDTGWLRHVAGTTGQHPVLVTMDCVRLEIPRLTLLSFHQTTRQSHNQRKQRVEIMQTNFCEQYKKTILYQLQEVIELSSNVWSGLHSIGCLKGLVEANTLSS